MYKKLIVWVYIFWTLLQLVETSDLALSIFMVNLIIIARFSSAHTASLPDFITGGNGCSFILIFYRNKWLIVHFNIIWKGWAQWIKNCIRLSCLKRSQLIVDRIIVDLARWLVGIRKLSISSLHHCIFWIVQSCLMLFRLQCCWCCYHDFILNLRLLCQ